MDDAHPVVIWATMRKEVGDGGRPLARERYFKRYTTIVSVSAGSGVGSPYISQECPADSLRFASIHCARDLYTEVAQDRRARLCRVVVEKNVVAISPQAWLASNELPDFAQSRPPR